MSKVKPSEVDYQKLNLRFNVIYGKPTQIIVNCDKCKGDHIFEPPNGEWNIADIINNLERFAFGSSHRDSKNTKRRDSK